MKIHKSYKTELNPNNKQKTLLNKGIGVSRFCWNWALDKISKRELKPNYCLLSREFNKIKEEQYSFVKELSKYIPQIAFENIEQAFKRFFNYCKNKKGSKVGYPKFKSKKNIKNSFTLTNDKESKWRCNNSIEIKSNKIKLPKLKWLKLKQKNYLPKDKKILSATISFRANKWFVSINTEEEIEIKENISGKVIGIDLGINTLAVCSDDIFYPNPKVLNKNLKKLQKLQRRLDKRQQKGSKRSEITKKRIAKLHFRISNIRKDNLNKITSEIVKTKLPEVIVLEDLSISNMLKNHKLAKSIADASFYEFRRQIEYKAKWFGVSKVLIVDRFFPSSKTCSFCYFIKKDLKQSNRVFKCENCGLEIDRDLNASKNLEKEGQKYLTSLKQVV